MRLFLFLLFCSFLQGFKAQPSAYNWEAEKVEVLDEDGSALLMGAEAIYAEGWDTLCQPKFWKQIMLLSPDSCLINVMSNRQILEKKCFREWMAQTEAEKDKYKDSLKILHNIASNERIFVTTGKNDFYRFNDVYPELSRGIIAFEKEGVDPWYAQAILLIESPGQLKKSSTGAYGAFQLMPGVARAMGLTVNKHIDERKDFDKSAYGSARLIKRVCIPEAKHILDNHNITYNENDLWFRLFVLHVYHAGAMNVASVVNKINPDKGSQDLILQMWQTSSASFGNNSQNYTQLALASQLILDQLIHTQSIYVYNCSNSCD